MQKRILPVFLSLILVACMGSVAVQARAQKVTPSLTFSGTTAQCSAVITSSGEKIQATMELWQGNKLLQSWSDNGVSFVTLDGSHRVSHGETYTLEVHGSIGGSPFEGNAVSRKCP